MYPPKQTGQKLLSAGIRIPEDLGLIGWDNLLIGECLPVTLTTLYYDQTEIAQAVLQMILAMWLTAFGVNLVGDVLALAAAALTLYSMVEYVWQNRAVLGGAK